MILTQQKAAHTILLESVKSVVCCPRCGMLLFLFLALRLCNTPGLATKKAVNPSAACILAIHHDAEGVFFASSWCCAVWPFLYAADLPILFSHGTRVTSRELTTAFEQTPLTPRDKGLKRSPSLDDRAYTTVHMSVATPMLGRCFMNATSSRVSSGYRCESQLDLKNQPGFRRIPVWSLHPVLSLPCMCQHYHVREHQKIYGVRNQKGCYICRHLIWRDSLVCVCVCVCLASLARHGIDATVLSSWR